MKRAIRKAMEHPDRLGAGAAKRRQLSSRSDKVETVMAEYKRGTLRSGSGHHVTNRKQAVAIAMHESGHARPPINTPIFDVQEPEVKRLGPPWWEEPVSGPPGNHVEHAGGLINQGALMQTRGTSGAAPGKGDVTSAFEPTVQQAPLTDADFHNKPGKDISPGTDVNVKQWARGTHPDSI